MSNLKLQLLGYTPGLFPEKIENLKTTLRVLVKHRLTGTCATFEVVLTSTKMGHKLKQNNLPVLDVTNQKFANHISFRSFLHK